MPSRWDTVQVDGADMRCYVASPDSAGPHPVIVVIQHAGGVDQFIQGMTDRLASEGDAAIAPDPLSGNGIFNALSTALVAPTVINTILQSPSHASLAAHFYQERVRHAFMRFARLGRDFYRMEQRWTENSFWQQRQAWPDQLPTHEPESVDQLKILQRPVVKNNLITSEEVVVTPDQPLGIWHLDGTPLAPLVNNLFSTPLDKNESIIQRLEKVGITKERHAALITWLKSVELI